MFKQFGEFNSAEQINEKAAELKAAGDTDGLKILVKENGIDNDDYNDYINGELDELTTPLLAALGKIKVESNDLKIGGTLADWVKELEEAVSVDPEITKAVRKKHKSLAGYIAATADYGYSHRTKVDKRIVNKCPEIKKVIGNHPLEIGVPDKRERKKIMREYYLGGNS